MRCCTGRDAVGRGWGAVGASLGLVACLHAASPEPTNSTPAAIRRDDPMEPAAPAASVAPIAPESSAPVAPVASVAPAASAPKPDEVATSLRIACADPETGAYVGCVIQGRVVSFAGPVLELAPSDHTCRDIPAGAQRVEPARDGKKLKVLVRVPPALDHRARQLFQKGTPVCGAFFRLLAGYDPAYEGVIETPDGHPLLAFSDWLTRRSDLLREVSIRPSRELRRRRMEEDYWQIERSITVSYRGRFHRQQEGDEWRFDGATYWLRAAASDSSGKLPPWMGWQRGGGVRFELLALER